MIPEAVQLANPAGRHLTLDNYPNGHNRPALDFPVVKRRCIGDCTGPPAHCSLCAKLIQHSNRLRLVYRAFRKGHELEFQLDALNAAFALG